SGMRFEYRTPDPLCNPYLLFTGLLAVGMDGVDRELDPGPPASENIFEMTEEERESRGITILPDSLHKALDALHADDVIRGALGEKMTETYIDRKREESFNC
ncbi:glutamine synthetase, partial [candidate division MSBL1 archaeon SCGC-AAA259M10]